MKFSRDELVGALKAQGFSFVEFTWTQEGSYAAKDAEWNYKDVAHVNYAHEAIRGIWSVVEDDELANIYFIKPLGFKIPLPIFTYQSRPDTLTKYIVWSLFVLVVENVYTEIAPNQTRVETTYSLGAPKFLQWCFPLIRWALKKTNDALMADDLEMRRRRGELRSWGYAFRGDSSRYSFEKTMDIGRNNVICPVASNSLGTVCVSVERSLSKDGELLIGRGDHLGLRILRSGHELLVLPRLCLHEGASLDDQACVDGRLLCPWHGRASAPLATFDLAAGNEQRQTSLWHELSLTDGTLTIKARNASEGRHEDN